MKAYAGSEQSIQNSVKEYLENRGYYTMRINSGKIKSTWDYKGKTPKQYSSWVQLAPKGTPDMMVIKDGVTSFIEFKKPKKERTEEQKMMAAKIQSYGVNVYVIKSLEELMPIYG